MSRKSRILLAVVSTLLLLAFVTPGVALAWSGCGSSYYVQRGDTLSGIAVLCGTSIAAIRQANPSLGYYLYAGQTLSMPGGYNSGYNNGYNNGYPGYVTGPTGYGTYVVARGDTLRNIAARTGFTVSDMIAANPQLWNPNLIYAGQVINLPGSSSGTTYYDYNGYPTNYGNYGSGSTYTVQWGDTLRMIATRYGTTVENLMALNPQISNRHWIYAGQVLRVW